MHLLDNGLSVNHKFKRRGNIDLLHMVCRSRNDERSVPLARELLAHGAGVDTAGGAGFTPLHEAVAGGHYDLATLLLAHGAGVDTADEAGWTPLHEAVADGDYDLATLLLAHGAAVDSRTNSGNTPLHMVSIYADRADCRLASLLLEHGADVNAIDFDGRTSLHLLSTGFFGSEWDHDLSMAAFLLKNGADVNVMAKNGRSPLQEAMDDPSFSEEHRDRLIELLIAHGADNHPPVVVWMGAD
jgi:ankyrin repeat protein